MSRGSIGPGVKTKALLACGVIVGQLFVAAFPLKGAARTSYDPLRHAVSSFELSPSGWMQSASFVVAGLLTLAFGLRRAPTGEEIDLGASSGQGVGDGPNRHGAVYDRPGERLYSRDTR